MSVTMKWRVLIFRMEKRSAEMDGSCEYIKQTVPDWSQMVAPSFVFGRGTYKIPTQKLTIWRNNSQWGGASHSGYGNGSSGSTISG